jgi:bacterioferritin
MTMTHEQRQAAIAMLNEDMEGEHGAIIQYLLHAYAMGEGEFACEVEAIARDEMRHLHWLAEEIVELGGRPSMKLGTVTYEADGAGVPVSLDPEGPMSWLAQDVGLEQSAIALYRKHLKAIDDPGIQRLIQRIISDETRHERQFGAYIDEIAEEGLEPEFAGEGGGPGPETLSAGALAVLQEGLRHEYTVILQYLYHSFLAPAEIGEELDMQAINEMQHMGWFAEEIAGKGIMPKMGHDAFDRSEDVADMLRADIAAEQAVTREYNEQLEELDDPGLRELVGYIRDHEIYHDGLFSDMLAEVKRAEAAKPKPTVGSLLDDKE